MSAAGSETRSRPAAAAAGIDFMQALRHGIEIGADPIVAAEDAIRRAVDRYYDQTTSIEDVMNDFDDSDIDLIQESVHAQL